MSNEIETMENEIRKMESLLMQMPKKALYAHCMRVVQGLMTILEELGLTEDEIEKKLEEVIIRTDTAEGFQYSATKVIQ